MPRLRKLREHTPVQILIPQSMQIALSQQTLLHIGVKAIKELLQNKKPSLYQCLIFIFISAQFYVTNSKINGLGIFTLLFFKRSGWLRVKNIRVNKRIKRRLVHT